MTTHLRWKNNVQPYIQRMLAAKEVVQWLRALSALSEDPSLAFSSQLSLTPVSGNPTPSSDFHQFQVCIWYTDTHTNKTPIHV